MLLFRINLLQYRVLDIKIARLKLRLSDERTHADVLGHVSDALADKWRIGCERLKELKG